MSVKSILSQIFKMGMTIIGVLLLIFVLGFGSLIGKMFGGTPSTPAGEVNREQIAELLEISPIELEARLDRIKQETQQMPLKESHIAAMEAASHEMNKTLPKMFDTITRRDRTTTGPGLTINFEHTILTDINTDAERRRLHTDLQASIKRDLCSLKEVQTVLNSGGAYRYIYHSQGGDLLADIHIAREDCP